MVTASCSNQSVHINCSGFIEREVVLEFHPPAKKQPTPQIVDTTACLLL